MIFDKFCGLAERRVLPGKMADEMTALAREAHLFALDGDPTEFLEPNTTLLRNAGEDFFLPFDCIAVEDARSCVFLRNATPGLLGLRGKRFTMEIRELGAEDKVAVAAYLDCDLFKLRDAVMISPGEIYDLEVVGDKLQHSFCLDGVYIVSRHSDIPLAYFPASRRHEEQIRMAAQDARTAIEEVAWINSPDFFILERTQVTQPKIPAHRIPRADQRAVYSVLHRKRIREQLGLAAESDCPETGREMNPHPRRAHYRVLRDERFAASGKQGKQIFVRSTWVGPSESVQGRYRYKVLLDR